MQSIIEKGVISLRFPVINVEASITNWKGTGFKWLDAIQEVSKYLRLNLNQFVTFDKCKVVEISYMSLKPFQEF